MDANIKRNEETIRFFESGLTFTVKDGQLEQQQMLSLLATGQAYPEQWGETAREIDFYDVKNDIEAILSLNGVLSDYEFKPAKHDALHPGQTAELVNKEGEQVGFIGLIHPALEGEFDIKSPVYLVELKQSLIQIKDIPEYQGISKYPSVRRDLALILDEKSHVNEIVDYISKQYSLVNEVIVFDIYQGKGVESGRKSVALGLILQDKSKTLVEQDVEQLIEDLLNKLDNLFNARLRE